MSLDCLNRLILTGSEPDVATALASVPDGPGFLDAVHPVPRELVRPDLDKPDSLAPLAPALILAELMLRDPVSPARGALKAIHQNPRFLSVLTLVHSATVDPTIFGNLIERVDAALDRAGEGPSGAGLTVAELLDRLAVAAPALSAQAETLQSNFLKHGAPDGFDWRLISWGVLADTRAVCIDRSEGLAVLFFKTQDVPPSAAIQFMSSQHPRLHLRHDYLSPGGEVAGVDRYKAGQQLESTRFPPGSTDPASRILAARINTAAAAAANVTADPGVHPSPG